jgi:hypothetical protein
MGVLHLAREPSDERTGVFTCGVVSTAEGRRIALFFTGRQHAGENLEPPSMSTFAQCRNTSCNVTNPLHSLNLGCTSVRRILNRRTQA